MTSEKGPASPNSANPKPTIATRKPDVPANFKLAATLKGHSHAVVCVQFSPDEATLASASGDCTCKLWDSTSGQLLQTLEGHEKVFALSEVGWVHAMPSQKH